MHTAIEKKGYDSRLIAYPSIIAVVFIALTSTVGIFSNDFYRRESVNWQLQSGGQDIINLLLVLPLLLMSVVSVHLNKRLSMLIWAGTMLYCFYTFTIYCFDVHFNNLFLLYCAILCISIYTLIYFLHFYLDRWVPEKALSHYPFSWTGIYFLLISISFGVLWLMDIIPAVTGGSFPETLSQINLPTNPVHVLDLSFILPGIFLTGISLLGKHRIGYLLAPVFLVFFMLMDVTIAILAMIMKTQGQGGSFMLAGGMIVLAIISLGFFISGLKALPYEKK